MSNIDREYFIRARGARHLSQAEVALQLGTTRATVANFESGRVEIPRHDIAKKIEKLIASWRAEDEIHGVVHEERSIYVADAKCGHCGKLVPGPDQNAKHCIWCGEELGYRACYACGKVTRDMLATFCGHCGAALRKKEDRDDENG